MSILFLTQVGIKVIGDFLDQNHTLAAILGQGLEVWKNLLILHIADEHQVQAEVVETRLERKLFVPLFEEVSNFHESLVQLGVLQQQQRIEHLRVFIDHEIDISLKKGVPKL
jgi:hypothetical protein